MMREKNGLSCAFSFEEELHPSRLRMSTKDDEEPGEKKRNSSRDKEEMSRGDVAQELVCCPVPLFLE